MPARSTPCRFARLILIPVLSLLACAVRLSAQDIQPPDLWDIATGEQIPGSDVLKTKDFGAVIAAIPQKVSAAWQGGLRPGDIILGVDGMRTFGSREYQLARFRNLMASKMTLLINRDGDLEWHKLHGLTPGRDIGVRFDLNTEQDRFLNAVESLGLPVSDESIIPPLRLLPAHAAAAVFLWTDPKKSPTQPDTAWLQEFINLYAAIQGRHYAEASSPAHEPPIPYFQRLEKFYLSLAAANQPKETPPDLQKSGVTPEFYTLAVPVPYYKPALGDLHFSDLRFKTLVTRLYASNGRPDEEIATAANEYASNDADGLDAYLSEIKAAILDPDTMDGWPYRSYLVARPVSRTLLIQQLSDRMKDESAPDWPLDACAMVSLDFLNGSNSAAADLVAAIGKHSPWLAVFVAQNASDNRQATKGGDPQRFRYLRLVMSKNQNFLGSDIPALYTWAVAKVGPLGIASREIPMGPIRDPYFILTAAPYAELSALKGVQPPPPNPAPPNVPGEQSD